MIRPTTCDVLVIGAGPSGLAAATQLKKLGVSRVLVIDREREPGGIPRQCVHTGFGFSDLRRILPGPKYAQAHVQRASAAGATIQTEWTAVEWPNRPDVNRHRVLVTSPGGMQQIDADVVLVATGCRERPRSARLIPGARPGGIYTTGSLQQWVHLLGQTPGKKAVVVGAEHVSYSAVLTLNRAGCRVVAMVSEFPGTQTYAFAHWWIAGRNKIPLYVDATVTGVLGKERVEGIEIEISGKRSAIACDCLVFTGDWIPDHEFCRTAGVVLDLKTRGPAVDQGLRTSTPGVFASGNLLRGAETAAVASLEGRHAAQSIATYLSAVRSGLMCSAWPVRDALVPINVEDPIRWVSPGCIALDGTVAPRRCLTFRVSTFLGPGRIVVCQEGRTLHVRSFKRLTANRWYTLTWGAWIKGIDDGGQVNMMFEPTT